MASTFLALAAQASTTVLYDGPAGTTPAAQGWLFQFTTTNASSTTSSGQTTLSTTFANSERGGYSSHVPVFNTLVNPAFPTLDVNVGFSVRLDMKLLSETHANNNRAGTSLIVIASDLRGIELGFWTDEVWAQSGPDFLHAEGAVTDTTAANASYVLSISNALGGSYALTKDGSPLLSGPLRNYSSFGLPYSLPNYLFLGDNTTSASGAMSFSHLSVTVPEPTILGLLVLSLPTMLRRLR
jgi:hypothetical protein